jgi:hypothetical protein
MGNVVAAPLLTQDKAESRFALESVCPDTYTSPPDTAIPEA